VHFKINLSRLTVGIFHMSNRWWLCNTAVGTECVGRPGLSVYNQERNASNVLVP